MPDADCACRESAGKSGGRALQRRMIIYGEYQQTDSVHIGAWPENGISDSRTGDGNEIGSRDSYAGGSGGIVA